MKQFSRSLFTANRIDFLAGKGEKLIQLLKKLFQNIYLSMPVNKGYPVYLPPSMFSFAHKYLRHEVCAKNRKLYFSGKGAFKIHSNLYLRLSIQFCK